MHLTQAIVDFCAELISKTGYIGIFILMFCESMYIPVPSEAVMPFVGFLAWQASTGARAEAPDFWIGVAVGVLGGIGGSLTTYYFGKWAGPVGVRKWGRYGGLVPEDLDKTHALFERWGMPTVFLARLIPVVRHFISTVAGIAKMSLLPFIMMTTAGAFIWDLFLAWAGWHLAEHYHRIHDYQKWADLTVVTMIIVFGVYLGRKLRARTRSPVMNKPADLDAPNVTS
jgi:membrane protein DedA with SNARE-associated domain